MPRIDGPSAGDGIQAVSLALQILEHLAVQRGGTGVTAIATALGASKSRVHRHLRTLMEQDYVVQSANTDKYRVGSRLVTLGRAVAEHFDLASVARPIMRALRDQLGRPVVLSQPDPAGARVLATMLGTSPIEISVREGSVLGFHCSSQGKVALAWADGATLARVLHKRLERKTPHSIVDPALLRAELATIRDRGWAVSPNEALVGVNALAAPLFDGSGALVGALAIVDSVQFIEPAPTEAQIQAVTASAAQISRALGYGGPPSPS